MVPLPGCPSSIFPGRRAREREGVLFSMDVLKDWTRRGDVLLVLVMVWVEMGEKMVFQLKSGEEDSISIENGLNRLYKQSSKTIF